MNNPPQPPHFTGAPQPQQPNFTTGQPAGGGNGNGAKIAVGIAGAVLFLGLIAGGAFVALSASGGDEEAIEQAVQEQLAEPDRVKLMLPYEQYGEIADADLKVSPIGDVTITSQDEQGAEVTAPGSLTRPLNLPPFYDQGGEQPAVKMNVTYVLSVADYPKGWFVEDGSIKERDTTPKTRPAISEGDRQEAASVARRALLAATNVGGAISTASYDAKQPDVYLTGPGRKGLNATSDERARFSRVLPPTSGPKGGVRDTAETLLINRNDLSCFSKGVKQVRTTAGSPRFDARVKGDRPSSRDLQVVWVSFPTQLGATYTCSDFPKNTTKKLTFSPRIAVALVRPAVELEGSQDWRVAAMKIDDPKSYAQPLYEPFDLSLPFRPTDGS